MRYESEDPAHFLATRLLYWDYAWIAAINTHLGRDGEARAAAATAVRSNPKFSIRRYLKTDPYADAADVEKIRVGFRMAGPPES